MFGEISLNGTDADGQVTVVGGGIVLVVVFIRKYLAALVLAAVTASLLLWRARKTEMNNAAPSEATA